MGILSILFGPAEPKKNPKMLPQIQEIDEIYSPPNDYTVVDLETSGLDPCRFDILEIGAIKYRSHQPVGKFQSFVRPTGKISQDASAVNHIYWDDVSMAPELETVMARFLEFLQDDIIIGYNVRFDIAFLQTRSQRHISNCAFDVLKFTRRTFPSLERYRLDDMRKNLHISGGSHRAIDDCDATAQVYQMGLRTQEGRQILANAVPIEKIEEEHQKRVAWNEWLENGQFYYNFGEDARKAGRYDEAIQYFEKAKECKSVYPFLFNSYAMVYRKQRDYQKEIDILEEGIARLGTDAGRELVERREKAQMLLKSKVASEQIERERAQRREARAIKKLQAQKMRQDSPSRPKTRSVTQMDDSGRVIKVFPSLSSAAKEIGISTKSIRAAASGVQKHAGGFCWKYEESIDEDSLEKTEVENLQL